ncbi:MAG: hypothetical protein M1826_006894 [Phylliscum demangeonii]|nr:MAG: hypothetical protein M1826_006894 [Phylliscum demangeonii]
MKFVHYLFPVCAFIVASASLYIPTPSPWEQLSTELARPDTPSTFADRAGQEKSWPSHAAERQVQKHAWLAKRTTDEESASKPEDVEQEALKPGTNSSDGPILYTPEEMAAFREGYNTARRSSDGLRTKVQRAKAAGAEVSPDDLAELKRRTAVTYQQKVVVARARKGKPVDRKTSPIRQDIASLIQDPAIQEMAELGDYNPQQLAEYRRSFLDSLRRFREKKTALAEIAKVRMVTEAEEQQLAELKRAYNLQRKVWDRVRDGQPADYVGRTRKQSVDRLQQKAKLQEIAQTSGYSVRELAEVQRSYLDAHNAARSFALALSKITTRPVTADERAQLQALWETTKHRKRAFDRMCRGRAAAGDRSLPRKDAVYLVKDAEMQRIAHAGGYPVEEVAAQKRAFLDATYRYRDAQRAIAAVKQAPGRSLTPAQEDDYVTIDHAYHLHKAAWERMTRGEPADPALPPAAKLGHLAHDVAGLVRHADGVVAVADGNPAAPASPVVKYTAQQLATYDRQYVAALHQLRAFEAQIGLAAAEQRPRAITAEEGAQLKELRAVYQQRKTEWARVHQGLVFDGGPTPVDDGRSVTYTSEAIERYHALYLAALRKLRAFDKQQAAARRADPHSGPSAADDEQQRALRDDFSQKKRTWTRARLGKPLDRIVHQRRAPPSAQKKEEEESGSRPAPAPPQQPLPISIPRRPLLAPVLASASHFLHALGRQWRAMPWTRYLARPRPTMDRLVPPPEWLRAEHAL